MVDRVPKHGDCYVYWVSNGFIDIRKARIISYKAIEQKMGTKYVYILKRFEIDYYEMYKDSLYFNELIDPEFVRSEFQIYDTFTDGVFKTMDWVASLNQRMVNMITHEK